MKFITLSLLLIVSSLNLHAQDRPTYFVQFKIVKITTEAEAKVIDKKMAGKKGIISTNTDHVTSTYFCTLDAEADYSYEQFESWLDKLGYEISCFNKGSKGTTSLISPYDLKNCTEDEK